MLPPIRIGLQFALASVCRAGVDHPQQKKKFEFLVDLAEGTDLPPKTIEADRV
jgi:hypothetical protein